MLRIPHERLITRLQLDNPWWRADYDMEQAAPEEKRLFFSLFRKRLEARASGKPFLLSGPRGAGKTVLLRQFIHELIKEEVEARRVVYFPLKNPVYYGCTLKDCVAFALEGKRYVPYTRHYLIFDDIQYLPGWEKELQSVAEANPLSVVIGVSSLAPGAGKDSPVRMAQLVLPLLNFAEYMHITRNADLFDPPDREISDLAIPASLNLFAVNRHFGNYMKTGGYPEAVFSWEMRRSQANFARSGVLEKSLLTDIPGLYGVGEIKELNRFFCALALANGMETSQDRLRKDAGFAKNTMRRYLEYLEAAFVMSRLRRIDEHNKEFIRERHFRLFLASPSTFGALFAPPGDEGADPEDAATDGLMRAAVLCQFPQGNGREQLRYARWSGGEIECLYFNPTSRRTGGSLGLPLWIASLAWNDDPHSRPEALKALAEYRDLHGYEGPVIFLTKSKSGQMRLDTGLTLELVPASLFAYGIGMRLFSSP